jgi:hypothetical protein
MNTPKSSREAWEFLRDHHLARVVRAFEIGDVLEAEKSATRASYAEWQISKCVGSVSEGAA